MNTDLNTLAQPLLIRLFLTLPSSCSRSLSATAPPSSPSSPSPWDRRPRRGLGEGARGTGSASSISSQSSLMTTENGGNGSTTLKCSVPKTCVAADAPSSNHCTDVRLLCSAYCSVIWAEVIAQSDTTAPICLKNFQLLSFELY